MHIVADAGAPSPATQASYREHLRVPDLSLGTYSLPAGGTDPQRPHSEDELYLCIAGHARLWTPTATAEIRPGVVAFVPAGEEHRFIDIAEDLTVLVVFGPAEGTRAG
ncbi:MAG: cupin domain-containing protein [Nocardioides sp.]